MRNFQFVWFANSQIKINCHRMFKLLWGTLMVVSFQLAHAQSHSEVKYAEISFLEKEYHFGVINEGEQVQNVLEFTNTSAVPLVISNARGNCGCTIPEFSPEPIMPGETQQILVRFDSKKKTGRQKKSILITGNTDPEVTIINFVGLVRAVTDKSSGKYVQTLTELDAKTLILAHSPEEASLSIDLTAYPNSQAGVEIYDMRDQLMYSEENVGLAEIKKIDTSALAVGTYVVSLRVDGRHRITRQFVKS